MNKKATNQKARVEKEPAGPTVKPSNSFDPDTDSKRLYEAMDGLGTNEDVIIDIIPHRCNAQRQEIKVHYEQTYGKVCKNQSRDDKTSQCACTAMAADMRSMI